MNEPELVTQLKVNQYLKFNIFFDTNNYNHINF